MMIARVGAPWTTLRSKTPWSHLLSRGIVGWKAGAVLSTLAVGLALAGAAGPAFALSQAEARHFANRTGYIALPSGVDRFLPMSREQAVDTVLAELRTAPSTPAPSWVKELPKDRSKLTDEERTAYDQLVSNRRRELRTWWYLEMLATPSPLTDKIVYVWHNHFVSGIDKVSAPQMMYWQNALFRREGTTDFGRLLAGIVRDPAMLVYLDNNRNVARAPNENLARELMELFTIGIGNYGETDVKEVARALTGYTVDNNTWQFRFDAANHDAGRKTILGQTGAFNGDDVARILRDHPKTAEMVATKFWKEFVTLQPPAAEVSRLAGVLRDNAFQMRPFLRALLLSPAFWEPANRAALIKAPYEFAVQTARQLGLPVTESLNLQSRATSMGQDLFNPPNVKGWPGGFAWINTSTLPQRQGFVASAVSIWRTEVAPSVYQTTVANLPRIDAAKLAELNTMWLTVDPTYVQPTAPVAIATALQAVLMDAGYQTK